MLEHAGQESTDDFEDVGHSADAREIMAKMKIGVIEPEKKAVSCGCNGKALLLPAAASIAVAALAFLLYKYLRRGG